MMNRATQCPSLDTPDSTGILSWFLEVCGVAGLLYVGGLARIHLPFTPAPFTLQTLVVLTVPFLSGRNRAFSGTALFILLGLTAPAAGLSFLAAPPGVSYGYLAGFMVTPFIAARFPQTRWGVASAMALCSSLILILGALWMCIFLGSSFAMAAALGITPFLAGDLVKGILAYKLVAWHLFPRVDSNTKA